MLNNNKYTGDEYAPNWTTHKEEWNLWFRAFINKYKKKKKQNSFSFIYPEIVKLLQENYSDDSKRIKGIGRRIMISLLKEKLIEINTGKISRAINKCLSLQILSNHQQTKNKKLLIKGQYWKNHVGVN